MNFKIIYINIFLVVVIAVWSFVIVQLWTSKDLILDSIKPLNYNSNIDYEKRQVLKRHPSKIFAYSDIVTKNLFSPKREKYVPEPVKPEPEKIGPEPGKIEPEIDDIPDLNTNKIKLYGVLLLNPQYRRALITDLNTRNKKHNSIWVEIGDEIGKFVVDAIYSDKIIVKQKGKKFAINLYDTEKVRSKKLIEKNNVTSTKLNNNKKKLSKNKKKLSKNKKAADILKQMTLKNETNSSNGEYVDTPFGKFKIKKRN